ncbi:MAG: DUF87 domain-containing protein [Lachnospiraceae bacterium]|nr:DUF87 domain-containing protein [Lachnospiraceae bacterium]
MVLRSQREGRARGWFWDRITPSVLHFYLDYAVVGNTYRSFWAIREYAPSTTDQAILKSLAAIPGVTLRIYAKRLTPMEEAKLLQSGGRKSVYQHNAAETLQRAVETQEDLNDMTDLFRQMRKDKELLIYCSVFIECRANTKQELTNLQMNVRAELMAYKLSVDELHLQQREGMLACHPLGSNVFGKNYCRPLPASSVANLYPISFSGRLDPRGLRIGKDRYGSDIYLDLDRRTSDVTNGNVVILGNAGEGKSWLVKLLCTNLIEQGKSLYLLDPEGEYRELIENLGGTYLDFLSGEYKINLLQPKRWEAEETADSAATFRMTAMPLSMHISYLKDFFRVYKEFDVQTLDTLEILLSRFYEEKEIYDENAFALPAEQYPIMEDFYCYVETVYASKEKEQVLYAEEILRRILTALYSMARGAEAVYFNGHTNLPQSRILAFGVQGLLETNKYLKNAVLFHLLSYFSDKLLVQKNAAAVLEEFYLFLTSEVVVEYVRNIMKRDRKQDSLVILASQNIEDYLLPLIKELTKPLLAIPSHQFLFYPGNVIQKEYCDLLQVDEVEYGIIRKPERGRCLYRCGSERYVLLVQAPEHKARLFGAAGGR